MKDNDRYRKSTFELAEITYREVLDATKHQDDKIGRFITGMAFLVAGALAFIRPDVLEIPHLLGKSQFSLTAVTLGVFVGTIAVAALLFVLATSTPLAIPPTNRAIDAQGAPATPDSRLYFRSIVRRSRQDWSTHWEAKTHQDLEDEMRDDFIREAYNIARRTDTKATTSHFGSLFFVVALQFFVLSIVLAMDAFASPQQRSVGFIQWSLHLRTGIAFVLSVFPAMIIVQRVVKVLQPSDAEDAHRRTRVRALPWLILGTAMVVFSATLPYAWGLTSRIVFAAVAGVGALMTWRGYKDAVWAKPKESASEVRIVAAIGVLLLVFGVVMIIRNHTVGQLGFALSFALAPIGHSAFEEIRTRVSGEA